MGFSAHRSILLNDKSYLSLVKREIKQFADSLGFKGAKLGEIEIIISEICSNLFKHATKGREILYKGIELGGVPGIEIIAIDNGPGMKDSQNMMKDGVSTTGTLGQGLGAIKRLSHQFDIFSIPEWGTILLSRRYLEKSDTYKKPTGELDIRTIMVPKPGEKACGDAWAYKKDGKNFSILAMDGLGHGPDAEDAAQTAVKIFMHNPHKLPNDMLLVLHESLRKTRGGVGSILQGTPEKKTYNYCGIGNILTRSINNTKVRSLLSYNGIIGMNKPSHLHNQHGDMELKDIFVITSDGIKTRWDHGVYPGILARDGSIFGAAIYKDHSRRTDDSMVIVLRINTL